MFFNLGYYLIIGFFNQYGFTVYFVIYVKRFVDQLHDLREIQSVKIRT